MLWVTNENDKITTVKKNYITSAKMTYDRSKLIFVVFSLRS